MLKGTFGPTLLAKCREKGATPMAIKPLALTDWDTDEHPDYPFTWYRPVTDPELVGLCVRFTLDQGVSAAVPPGHEGLFFQAVDAGDAYEPLSDEELVRLREAAEPVKPLFPRG